MSALNQTFSGSNVSMVPPRSASSPGAAATAIWLDALVRSLDLPAQERQQIRMELQSHIEDRVRDLMVEGVEEGESTRRALSECGEASSLAGGFREVNKALRRRTLMNIGVVGAACGLVVLGFGSLRKTAAVCPPEVATAAQRLQSAQGAAASVSAGSPVESMGEFGGASAGVGESAASAGNAVTEIRNTGLEDVLTFIAKQSGHPFAINWASLATVGIERSTVVDATIPSGDPEEMIAVLNDVLGGDPDAGPGPLAIRERGGMLEIASAVWVDKHDLQLQTYDVNFVAENGVSPEALHATIMQFIEPSNWKDNGGERADMSVLGSRLIVKAPGRMHEKVRWMLEQLSASANSPMPLGMSEPGAGEPGQPEPLPEPGAGEFGQPAAMPEPGAGEPGPKTVRSVVMQHADANLVAALVKSMAKHTVHKTPVLVRTEPGQNRIVLKGHADDVTRCAQFAQIIDGAIAAPPRITQEGVPMLKDLPILTKFFSKTTASIDLPTAIEIMQPARAK